MNYEANEVVKKELDKIFSALSTDKISKQIDDILAVYRGAACRDLTPSQIKYFVDGFKDYVAKAYLDIFKINIPDVPALNFSNDSITTIVTQVWKRKVYFRVFHDGVRSMNEIKEAALYTFWILKLQPFYIPEQFESKNKLNVKIALKILLNGVAAFVRGKNKDLTDTDKANRYDFNFSGSMIEGLYYSFKYRDWSKESLMDLGERLVVYPCGESGHALKHYDEAFKDKVVTELLEKKLMPRTIAFKYDLTVEDLNQWVKERSKD